MGCLKKRPRLQIARQTPEVLSNIGKYLYPGLEIVVQIFGRQRRKGGEQNFHSGKIFDSFAQHQQDQIFQENCQQEGEKIRKILDEFKNDGFGFIVRTEALGKSKEDYINEYNLLKNTYQQIENSQDNPAPCCLYDQNELQNILIKDILRSDTDKIIVDDRDLRDSLRKKLKVFEPDLVQRLELFKEKSALFDVYNLQKDIDKALRPSVALPSGGNIKIEQTEALVVVDVNTGSFVVEPTTTLRSRSSTKKLPKRLCVR